MSFYNPAATYSPTGYATNPYSPNPYASVPNPFAANPYIAQPPVQQPAGGQQQDDRLQHSAGQAGKQPGPAQVTSFFGKAVTCIDEAKQSNMLFDGSVNIFTDIGAGKIYTRQLMLDGTVATNTYTLVQPQNAPIQAVIAPQVNASAQTQTQATAQAPAAPAVDAAAIVAPLQSKVAELENKLNLYEGMFVNGLQSNATGADAAGKSKSNGNASTGGGK